MKAAGIWQSAMENWPAEMMRHVPLLQSNLLSRDDLNYLKKNAPGVDSSDCAASLSSDVLATLSGLLEDAPKGIHLRLGLCSFKNAAPLRPMMSLEQIDGVLTAPNRRVRSIVDSYLEEQREAELFCFPWIDIAPWQEFRMFIKNGQCIGVSQYHIHATFPEIQANASEIEHALVAFWHNLHDDLHMRDAVLDVRISGPVSDFDVHLIEVNPFIWRTDPCLFTWRNGTDFDGSLRYHKSTDVETSKGPAMHPISSIENDYWIER